MLGNKRKNWRRTIAAKPVLLVMVILIFLLGQGVVNVYKKNEQAKDKVNKVLKQKEVLQKDYDALKKEMDTIKTNFGVEAELRRKFDIAKEGEELIVIVDVEKEIETVEEKKTWWGSVKEVFGY